MSDPTTPTNPPPAPTSPDKRQAAKMAQAEFEKAKQALKDAQANLDAKAVVCGKALQEFAVEAKKTANELAVKAKKAQDEAMAAVIEAAQIEAQAKAFSS